MTTQAARQLRPSPVYDRVRVNSPGRRLPENRIALIKAAALLIFCFLLALLYVYQQALIAQNAVEISTLKSAIRVQKTTNEKIKVQDMVLQSPGRLEQLAAEMGMVRPERVSYIVLPDEAPKQAAPPQPGLAARIQELVKRAGQWR